MTARRGSGGRPGRRRRIALAAAGIALLGGTLLLVLAQRGQAERQRRAERADAERAQRDAQAENLRAAQRGKRDRLARALARLQGPPAPAGALLAALARTTPPAIVLREVTCEGDQFVIRGHADGPEGGAENLLVRFRRDLCPPNAPWQIADSAPGPADFAWHGSFVSPAAADAEAAALEGQLARARAALRPAAAFDGWMQGWSRRWKILAYSAERGPDLEVRHYALAYAEPRLRAWSDIVQTLQLIGAEPGLTVDSLVLASAPEGADAFTQAQITLTARLRP